MIDLDEALERFHLGGLEYGIGFANHGPMVAEALIALGHGALVTGWLDLYAPRLPDLVVGTPIAEAERAAALGDFARAPDWIASFEAEVVERPWSDALRAWLPTLAPGLFAGAGHGLLRTAHAVRALEASDTPVRRRELAHGLAYWAARYQRLPGEPGTDPRLLEGTPRQRIDRRLAGVPVIPQSERPPGLFIETVRVLDGNAHFATAVAHFDPACSAPGEMISQLCRTGVHAYLSNPGARIGYVHAVTVPSALRLLLPYMDEAITRSALGACYQTIAALHAISHGTPEAPASSGSWGGGPPSDDEIGALAASEAEIRYRAACSLEEHAIKFASACLIEHALVPDDAYPRAAADAALALEGSARSRVC